jgi:hypothetical protein
MHESGKVGILASKTHYFVNFWNSDILTVGKKFKKIETVQILNYVAVIGFL